VEGVPFSFSAASPSIPDQDIDLFSVTKISILLGPYSLGINWPMILLFVLFVSLVPLVPIITLSPSLLLLLLSPFFL
jgi:hypothetical protein